MYMFKTLIKHWYFVKPRCNWEFLVNFCLPVHIGYNQNLFKRAVLKFFHPIPIYVDFYMCKIDIWHMLHECNSIWHTIYVNAIFVCNLKIGIFQEFPDTKLATKHSWQFNMALESMKKCLESSIATLLTYFVV